MLSGMKGKFLVNVGRGSIVDEEGLYLALRDGVLKGAALDPWYLYPGDSRGAPSRFPIHRLGNVVLSPHVGGFTRGATVKAVKSTIANLESWLATGECANEVDLAEMY
jgi:phosphoglycerate dehydrogenase-like enzyme